MNNYHQSKDIIFDLPSVNDQPRGRLWPKSCDTNVQAYSSEIFSPFRYILGKHDATVNHSRIQSPKIQYVFISDHALLNLKDMYRLFNTS